MLSLRASLQDGQARHWGNTHLLAEELQAELDLCLSGVWPPLPAPAEPWVCVSLVSFESQDGFGVVVLCEPLVPHDSHAAVFRAAMPIAVSHYELQTTATGGPELRTLPNVAVWAQVHTTASTELLAEVVSCDVFFKAVGSTALKTAFLDAFCGRFSWVLTKRNTTSVLEEVAANPSRWMLFSGAPVHLLATLTALRYPSHRNSSAATAMAAMTTKLHPRESRRVGVC